MGNAFFAVLDGRAHVGATASIFALKGAAFAERRETEGVWMNRENCLLLVSFAIEVAVVTICEQAFTDLLDGLELTYWAHCGGFGSGVLVMEALLKMQYRSKSEWSTYSVAALCIALASFHLYNSLVSSGPLALLSGLWA